MITRTRSYNEEEEEARRHLDAQKDMGSGLSEAAPALVMAAAAIGTAAFIYKSYYGAKSEEPVAHTAMDSPREATPTPTSSGYLASSPASAYHTLLPSQASIRTVQSPPASHASASILGSVRNVQPMASSRSAYLRDGGRDRDGSFVSDSSMTPTHLQTESTSSDEPWFAHVSIDEIHPLSNSQSSIVTVSAANSCADSMSITSSQVLSYDNVSQADTITSSDLLESNSHRSGQSSVHTHDHLFASYDSTDSEDYTYARSFSDADTISPASHGTSSAVLSSEDSVSRLPDHYVYYAGGNYTDFHMPSAPSDPSTSSEYSLLSYRSGETDF